MTVSELVKIAEDAGQNYSWFGIRQHHTAVAVGDILPNSWQQIDDDDCYELDGSCCMEFVVDNGEEELEFLIEELKRANYQDGPVVLVGGNSMEYGNDNGEIIIRAAEVLAIIE